jgi:hypothetical protein
VPPLVPTPRPTQWGVRMLVARAATNTAGSRGEGVTTGLGVVTLPKARLATPHLRSSLVCIVAHTHTPLCMQAGLDSPITSAGVAVTRGNLELIELLWRNGADLTQPCLPVRLCAPPRLATEAWEEVSCCMQPPGVRSRSCTVLPVATATPPRPPSQPPPSRLNALV